MANDKPPQNTAAETALLGALMLDPALLDKITLHESDFYLKKHQIFYATLLSMHARAEVIDMITVSEALERQKQLELVGGAVWVSELTMGVPSLSHALEYARIVKETALKRHALNIATTLASAAYNANGTLSAEISAAQAQLTELLAQPDDTDDDAETPVPELPLEIDLDAAGRAGVWVDEYVDYAMGVSPMTPLAFHESAALWLVSSAVARRVVLNMAFDKIYPNLWIAWIAPSTLFGKSTSMNLARRVAMQTISHLLTPEDMTPEGLLLDMAGMEPQNLAQMTFDDQQAWQKRRAFAAQRAWTMDEFSGLLATAGRDYNAGLLETLMRFYDCTEEYKRLTAGRGMQVVKNSYLSLLAASTPTAMAQHLTNERMWGMGWWPRFALLAPEGNRPDWAEPREQSPPDHLVARLRSIYERLPEPRWPEPLTDIPALLEPGVFDHWNRYNRALRYDLLTDELDHRLWAAYGRLPVTALKVATIFSILDWPKNEPTPRVAMHHMHRALVVTEEWRVSAHRVLNMALNAAEDKLTQRLVEKLQKNPGGMTLRQLYKQMKRTKPQKIERLLDDLALRGEVRKIEYQNPRGGPKTVKYAI